MPNASNSAGLMTNRPLARHGQIFLKEEFILEQPQRF